MTAKKMYNSEIKYDSKEKQKNEEESVLSPYEKIAKTKYDSQMLALNESKKRSQQTADIVKERLMKYIPIQNKAKGIDNIGTTSAIADAYSKYHSMMADIENEYADKQRQIKEEYDTAIYEGEEKDRQNALVNVFADYEAAMAEGKYERAKEILDVNRGLMDEQTYDSYKQTLSRKVKDALSESEYTSLSDRYNAYVGEISDGVTVDYDKIRGTGADNVGGYYVRDVKSGAYGETIGLTVGSDSLHGNSAKEYLLKVGQKVSDERVERALNTIATGDGTRTPSSKNTLTTQNGEYNGGKDFNSSSKNRRVVAFMDTLFIYTKDGWHSIMDGNADSASDALEAYLKK